MASPTLTPATAIVEVDHVSKAFPGAGGTSLTVLDDVSMALREGEIVALLGKSGSGKSTLLRTIAGLIAPTRGEVRYRGEVLNGANRGVGMVFQSFALMPWLTVQDNVELGLQARGIDAAERRQRALDAIDIIGLDGFEPPTPRSFPAACGNASGSPVPWCYAQTRCSWTNPSAPLTCSPPRTCAPNL